MTRPIVGIVGNPHMVTETYKVHGGSDHCCRAIADVTGAVPVVIPADPSLVSVADLMDSFDGFLLTGGRANVHPEFYGEDATDAHGDFDTERDGLILPLVRELTARGQPYFGVCRGFQEVAVAFGSTLHPEIRELPGRFNHRMPPDGTVEEIFELRQRVSFSEGGVFHRLMGEQSVMTNTLHGQGIDQPGGRIVIDGRADDTTPEAIYVRDAPGFTLSVQWHPEFNAAADPVSVKLFSAFGDALRSWARGGMEQRKSA